MVAATSAAAAPALPSGGKLVAGSATIGAPSSGSLTVNQTSSKAIIDWSGFSIGQGGAVQFDNGSGATLNRVTGSGVSSIDGLLSATGSVYLVNPNGVIVGKSGVVNTGGSFVASTLDVANSSFLAGGPLTFSGPSTASVVNLGKVGSLGGNVGLIAATVRNDGTITAPKGDVGLAAGTTVTLDDTANDAGGLFSVKVGGASTGATNSGVIAAAAVELRAQQGNVYALAGNAGGVINATGIDASGGVIKLISAGGTTEVAGTLKAQGANGTGGRIETSGETLDIGAASVDTHGGSWLLDPTDLIVDATAAGVIDIALASGNVTLATSASGAPTGPAGSTGNTASGDGDIDIESPITWSTSSTLTLDAHAALIIDAPITVTGAGAVVLDFDTAAADAPGGLSFSLGPTGFGGSISYATGTGEGIAGQALTINGTGYTLLYSLNDIAGMSGRSIDGALATSIVASAPYANSAISTLDGTLEGLGNTITNFTITGDTLSGGLIGVVSLRGAVRDIGLVGGSVSANADAGMLAADAFGPVEASYATGTVSGYSHVGGLVGDNGVGGTVEGSYATGDVSGTYYVGGLVGSSEAAVETSYATGAVSGVSDVGGLIGTVASTFAPVTQTYATGAVTGTGLAKYIGGLIGYGQSPVEMSYATGVVSGGDFVGGLLGYGASSIASVHLSYATGKVTGSDYVGGLVGSTEGYVVATYATGAVSGNLAVGGLVGNTIYYVAESYATGQVSGTTYVGGLVGNSTGGQFSVYNSYWDAQTTGQSGSYETSSSFGLTTAQLQSNFDLYMSNLNADGPTFGGGTGGLYPYLLNFNPNGVQAVSGFAPGGGTVTVDVAGANAGSVGVGANGYYYDPVAPGTIPGGGAAVIAYSSGTSGGAAVAKLTGTTSNFDVLPSTLIATTMYTTWSDASAHRLQDLDAGLISAAAGSDTTATTLVSGLTNYGYIATGPSFTIDVAPTSLTNGLFVQTTAAGATLTVGAAAGPLTLAGSSSLYLLSSDALIIDAPISIGSGSLYLLSSDALIIDAPISITGPGQVTLAFDPASANAVGGLSFGLTSAGFAGSISYANIGYGQSLTINGAPYALLFSMSDVAGIDGSSGDYALAAPIIANSFTSISYSGPVIGSFSATLEGLGNTIVGLAVTGSSDQAGLIGVQSGGIVRDIGLVGGSTYGGNKVGGLVGEQDGGSIADAYVVGGLISGGNQVGGLVGEQDGGSIAGAYVVVGSTSGSISGGNKVGGLVGEQDGGSIADAYVTVNVSGNDDVGDLVGLASGSITRSFVTGVVSGDASLGGLVGSQNAGAIADAYATGAVSGNSTIGGLVGFAAGSITDAYATGAVSAATSNANAGGLVGVQSGGAITDAYATGAVTASGGLHGLVGEQVGGSVTDGYYDASTTGQPLGAQSDGSVGMTTAALQAGALPTFQNASLWAAGPGLYPYLTTFFPNGAQAVTGYAPTGGTVTVDVAGNTLGSVSVGANGYFYAPAQGGTILGGGSAVIGYTSGSSAGARVETLTDNTTGVVTGFDILPATLIGPTTFTTWSSAGANPLQTLDASLISAAEGSDPTADGAVSGLNNYGYIATGSSFTIDHAPSLANGLYVQTTAVGAPITVAAAAGALTMPGANSLYLLSADALIIDAPINVSGAGQVTLSFDTASAKAVGGLGFDLSSAGFAGSLAFAAGQSGQSLTINGAPYTLLYSMSDVAGINGSSGDYALAAPITAASSYTSAVVGSFSGTLEGLGNTISGLTITGSGAQTGLIGVQSAGIVRDIGLVGGSVSGGNQVGGLVGEQDGGSIADAYVTVTVSGRDDVGDLVGLASGAINNSFAAGAVSGDGALGGLVGYQNAGSIADAYASGAVSGNLAVGGLVGHQDGSIADAYATGAVSAATLNANAGGLVGVQVGGAITDAYATGGVTASGGGKDGLVGDQVGGSVTHGYYDASTTGQPLGSQSDGSVGMTTAALQGALPAFQHSSLWSTGPGLYPYLTTFFPNGAQAVVGTAMNGASAAADAQVGIYAGGDLLGGGTVSTGANGYIYLAVPAGTLGASGDKIGADITLAGGTSPSGLVYTDAGSLTSNILTLPTLAAGHDVQTTSELTLSALDADLAATFGAVTYSGLQTALSAVPLTIDATGVSFTVDQALTWGGTGLLDIDATGALAIDAAVSVTAGGQVALSYGAGDLSFDLGSTGFAGSLRYATGTGEGIAGQALTINGTSYSLLYSMADVGAINGGSGHYALAAPITAAGSHTSAIIGSFTGTLEGLGNSISGLKINSAGSYVGLFGELNTGAVVRDVGLTGGAFTGLNFVGSLVGYNEVGATIDDSFAGGATVTSTGGADAGGLAGANAGTIAGSGSSETVHNSASGYATGGLVGGNSAAGVITASSASGSVTGGSHYTGGLAGYSAGTITGSSASGAVGAGSGAKAIGGLVGYDGASIAGDSASGNVTAAGDFYVGGLVGESVAGVTISNASDSGGIVTATGGVAVGGLVGDNGGTVSASTAADTVDASGGGYAVGGLVGYSAAGASITTSSASGAVTGGAHYTGGLAGYNGGNLASSFATGNVGAASGVFVGGLAGYNVGTIRDTYAYAGTVSGHDDVGGLVGYNAHNVSTSWSSGAVSGTSDLAGSIGKMGGGTITDVYWDEGTSGRTNATASGASTGIVGIGGTTGRNPRTQATYAGFNFTTTWTINAGTSRPFLLHPTPATPPN